MVNTHQTEVDKRRTFAIISHPDAGKTTLTEKLLLYGGAIQLAGSIKGKKNTRHATSDWLELEKKRGISVTTSVMQFAYHDCIINLLDTPGHADFSEDTYRTLSAVDSALMVIDAGKGVESRTKKLLEICRMRDMPIMTFINKVDRDTMPPLDLIDNIEQELNLPCAPITWPIGMGKSFKGIYHLLEDKFYCFEHGDNTSRQAAAVIDGLDSNEAAAFLGDDIHTLRDEIELIQGAGQPFSRDAYLSGAITPVFFGSAMNNFGVQVLLDAFASYAPAPLPREATQRQVSPNEAPFSGFVFKIQANMDPKHHDRMAFLRVCSGHYEKGIKVKHIRTGKQVVFSNATTFMAQSREHVATAYPGDIIGLPNHGTIQIGDTFTSSESLKFTGIPSFASELFRRIVLRDPSKAKALRKGLTQLSEEGAIQVFFPLSNNDIIVGAIGILQFDVMVHRMQHEYRVDCQYEPIDTKTAHWVRCDDHKMLASFETKHNHQLARDGSDRLVYLAPTMINLQLTQERFPDIEFMQTQDF